MSFLSYQVLEIVSSHIEIEKFDDLDWGLKIWIVSKIVFPFKLIIVRFILNLLYRWHAFATLYFIFLKI
jgi:hypothetical protein